MACVAEQLRRPIRQPNQFYFRNKKVLPEELPNRIHDAVLNGARKRVYLQDDARAQYRDVKALLPYVQLAGIRDVTFPEQTPADSLLSKSGSCERPQRVTFD